MAARKILMIEPKNFISNPQTVGDNFFQKPGISIPDEELALKTRNEFDSLVEILTHAGIEVRLFSQDDEVITPDAIFPNNWFSTFPGGLFILYPMMAENRRLERRPSVITYLDNIYRKKIDLSHDEMRGIFLEGTGSLVIDHANKIAYASLSQRTSSNLVFEWSKLTGYTVILFSAYDKNEEPVYHTNVLMCVAEKFAIACFEAMEDEDARERVKKSLLLTDHELIEITLEQMHHFCGNCLELENNKGEKFLLMSTQAFDHFTGSQKKEIEKFCLIIHTDLQTIETFGGGGARCMVAELL
ncbi:MAG: arginine deiminase-related protein [Bacteroidota bacterium]